MGSTNISEITEIINETNATYYMYVWDNAHEGRYQPFSDTSGNWNYPSDGRWLEIGPGARLRADDCGIPDGGKAAGKDRTRVIFKKKGGQPAGQGDPGYGIRVNRVGKGGGHDAVVFRNNANSGLIFELELPTTMHQSLLVRISDKDGVQFEQTDIALSQQAQAEEGLKAFGKALGDLLALAKNLSEIAAG